MAPSRGRVFGMVAGGIAVPLAMLACNGILGIDEYRRVECTGLVCVGADASPDTGPPPDAAAPDGGKGADPVSWARWVMPNYVIDGGSVSHPPSLKLSGGEVTDEVTKLVWRSTVENDGAQYDLSTARERCNAIAPLGAWRLPKRIELVTLLDYGHDQPFIDRTKFASFPIDIVVWSSSEVRPVGAEPSYWLVHFGTGAVLQRRASETAAILCVKAAP